MERLWALEGIRDIKVITGEAPRRQVRAHESVLRLRRSEGPILQQRLHRSAGPRQRATARVPALHREIIEWHKEGARNRLFIDEVQLCEGFEKAINSIHARGGWDIYLTGSNAFLLSSDLATLFTGRHREVHIPLQLRRIPFLLRRGRIGAHRRSRGTRSESGTPRCAPVSWRSRR